mgnify:CR=1 FL=1
MKKPLWSKSEEISLIKDIRNKKTLEELTIKYDRTLSALELRLQKIIHDNVNAGKSFETLSDIIGLPYEKLKQYYYEYCGYIDKKQRNKKILPDKPIQTKSLDNSNSANDSINISGGSVNDFVDKNNVKHEEHNIHEYERLERENKLMKLILNNIEMKKKIKYYIDQNILDASVIQLWEKN